jgi:hypothetical protein
MNVDEFGSKNGIKLWMFFVTSTMLTASVLVILGSIWGLHEWYKELVRKCLRKASELMERIP